MEPEVTAKLLALNRQFYQTRGEDFSATRMRLQPGVQRLLETIPGEARILDLGCGNGELARRLHERGFTGTYIGLDNSPTLLEIARERTPESHAIRFLEADLSSPSWEADITTAQSAKFDVILAFSVLHHLPDSALRLQILRNARRMIQSEGRLMHSEWQFLNSPRMRSRIQPWEAIGLSNHLVEADDYLLDWRHGGYGLRYVHHFSYSELDLLAAQAGFLISETFFSDGEGGKLGLYQVWLPEQG